MSEFFEFANGCATMTGWCVYIFAFIFGLGVIANLGWQFMKDMRDK